MQDAVLPDTSYHLTLDPAPLVYLYPYGYASGACLVTMRLQVVIKMGENDYK